MAASAPAPSVHANAYPTDAGRPKTWSVNTATVKGLSERWPGSIADG
jgi:hypothetical protein